jgi:hypothetical protein
MGGSALGGAVTVGIDDPRLPDRFWEKVAPEPNTGCWLWTASLNNQGYGFFGVGRRMLLSHRVSYEALIGHVQGGLHLDHLCRTRSCCNPLHLEPVTAKENARRGAASALNKARGALITHCPAGHLYDAGNTEHRPKGRGRRCRTCHRQKLRDWRAARAAQERRA